MGKHRSSSSSSSSSSDEDLKGISKEEKKARKKWKKQHKKGLIPPGTVPPWKTGGGCTAMHPHGGAPPGQGLYCTGPPPPMHPCEGLYNPGPPLVPPPPMHPHGGPPPCEGLYNPGPPVVPPPPVPPHVQHLDCSGVPLPGGHGPAVLDPHHGMTTQSHGGVQGIGNQMQQVKLDGCAELFRPTVRPVANFSAEADCEALRHAMKGTGTDERTIIGIIGQRSNAQRQDIAKFYKTMFGRDIITDLESDLSGNFREIITALFKPLPFYDAWSLHNAMEGAGTKEGVLIEILCTRTNQQIKEVVACYKEHFKRDLEKDIISDTSGHFKKLLISCSQGSRHELTPQQLEQVRTQGPAAVVDRNLAKEDAVKLQQAGVKKLGTDESVFITVLALRNMYQLQATFEEYQKLTGKDLLDDIGSETSGDFETGLKAIVRSARNRPEYFADKLNNCISGLGTNDSSLIRIVVSRSEIDLQDIKDVYLRKYKKTLESDVASDTSGDFKRLLLAIIGH